jgi:thioredoxin reductase (NADPH)
MEKELEKVETLIIGSGPAGYSAAIYAARADMKPVVIQGLQPGGQLTTTTDVDNYPGYKDGITGPEMMEDFKAQAERFGTDTRWGMVTKVDLSERPFKVEVDEKDIILAETVIIATGASAKWLGMDDEIRLNGYGVSACATCDGFFYKGKEVVVVGAGDTAAEEATYLAKMCTKVTILVRRDEMRASKAMQHRVFNTPNLEVLFNHETKSINGEPGPVGVESVTAINNITKEETVIPASGFFVAIGHKPNSDLFQGQLDFLLQVILPIMFIVKPLHQQGQAVWLP